MLFDEGQEVLVIKLDDIAAHQTLLCLNLYFVDNPLVERWLEAVDLLEGSDDLVELYTGAVGPEDQVEGAEDDLEQVVRLYELWRLEDYVLDGLVDQRLDFLAVL